MITYVPWVSPSRYLQMVQAVKAKVDLIADWNCLLETDPTAVIDLVASPDVWADGTKKLAVILKGNRGPVVPELKGTTVREYSCDPTIIVVVREEVRANRWAKLDEAECEMMNAIHELERDTDFGALGRELRVQRVGAVSVVRQGNAGPYAASAYVLGVQVQE